MNLEKLLFEPSQLVPGEIRQLNGLRSMYLKLSSRSAEVWATEGRYVRFSTDATHGYLKGRCIKVDGVLKTVSIQIIKGVFALGSIVVLPIDDVGRYEEDLDEADVAEMAQTLKEILEKGPGSGGPTMESLRELEAAEMEARHADFEARMGVLLGGDVYQWLKRVEPAFRDLTSAVSNDSRPRKVVPSPKIVHLHLKMRKVLASAPTALLKRGAAQ